MGNLCCIPSYHTPDPLQARLIEKHILDAVTKRIDMVLEKSGIFSIIPSHLRENLDIVDFTYSLALHDTDIRSLIPDYGSIKNQAGMSDMSNVTKLVGRRLIVGLKSLEIEDDNFGIILSSSRVRCNNNYFDQKGIEYDPDSTMLFEHTILPRAWHDSEYIKSRTPQRLYLKIVRHKLFHQYNRDILYQTEPNYYFRLEECVICYERIANVLYLGCMHLQICDKCQQNSSDPNYDRNSNGRSNCPICRTWSGHQNYDWIIVREDELAESYPLLAGYEY